MDNLQNKLNNKINNSNIKVIQQMLNGTHHSQKKKTISKNTNDQEIELGVDHKVGDTWVVDGIEWEQRAGFKIKKGKLDNFRQQDSKKYIVPDICPICGKEMQPIDKKFWKIEGRCLDCQIKYEHQLKLEGKYDAYEKDKMFKNAEAWFKETEIETKELIKELKSDLEFVNEHGTVETWSFNIPPKQMADAINKSFNSFKRKFKKQLDAYKKQVNNEHTQTN